MAKTLEVEHAWQAGMWDWPLQNHDGVVKVINTPEKFEVGLAVHYFTPKEIQVQVIGDKISVMCSHQERSDAHGTVSREVNRVYHIPPDVDMGSLKSKLGENGILLISAGKKK